MAKSNAKLKVDSKSDSGAGTSSISYSRYTGITPTSMVTVNDSTLTPSPFYDKSTDDWLDYFKG